MLHRRLFSTFEFTRRVFQAQFIPSSILPFQIIMAKRKRSSFAEVPSTLSDIPPPLPNGNFRRSSVRGGVSKAAVNPDLNEAVLDAPNALRASPDSDVDHTMIEPEQVV